MTARPGSRGSKDFTPGSRRTDAGKGQELRYSSLDRGLPAGNPIASALVIVVGSLAIAASIVIGFFAFMILGSLLMVLAAGVGIRLWWLRRKMARDPVLHATRSGRPVGTQQTIEGEYHVVIEDQDGRQG